MNDAQRITAFQLISRRIAEDAALIRHWPLTGGVSASIDALELELPDGQQTRFVVRRSRDHEWKDQTEHTIEIEFNLQQALFQEGLPVAEQVLLDTTCKTLPTPFAVMKMVDGSTEVPDAKVESAMRSMAEFLLRLHQLDPERVAVPGLPAREDPVAGALVYIPDTPQWSELRQAISRWQTADVPASILHGDFWPGNIIWHNDQIAAVIDWEDAATGTPVSDIACCRAEIMAMYGPQAVTLFTDHYHSQSALDFSDQPLWDAYCGFAALATMHSWGLNPDDEAARRSSTELFVKQAADQITAQRTG
ncbi:MAG: phosphotransferase [Pseudomonadaceae bacterium]|nr:phosphotransferase [Pseudomonadaceae bacterium]